MRLHRLFIICLLLISLTSFSQTGKERRSMRMHEKRFTVKRKDLSYKEYRADEHFNSYHYNEAIDIYKKVRKKDLKNYRVLRKIADSYKYIGNSSEASKYYEAYLIKGNYTDESLYNYSSVLRELGEYEKANEVLMNCDNIMRIGNHIVSDDVISKLTKDSHTAKITLIEASSPQIDFAPTYYGNKIIFSSSRHGTNIFSSGYYRDKQAYLQLYIADIDTDGQLLNIKPLEGKINSRYHDGSASYSNTDSTLYFTRNNYNVVRTLDSKGSLNLNLFESRYTYKKLKSFGDILSSIGIHTKMNKPEWRDVKRNLLNKDHYSIGHPSISSDGRMLYFVSDMPGGKGGTDIYSCVHIGTDLWSSPTNLRDINTGGDEMFPFIHEDGTLYFASNGLPGIGGLDIFKAEKNDKSFYKPENLGAPINSKADDFALIADKDLKNGYFSSRREGGKGGDDLYYIKFIDRARFILSGKITEANSQNAIKKVKLELICNETGNIKKMETDADGNYSFPVYLPETYSLICKKTDYISVSVPIVPASLNPADDTIQMPIQLDIFGIFGQVVNKNSKKPVSNVTITITDKSSKDKFVITTDEKGEFKKALKPNTNYGMFFDKSGYFILRQKYSTKDTEAGWVNINNLMEISIEKIEVGKTIEIPNIYYDLGKWDIRTDAAIELDNVVDFMADNPSINIELGSHSDSRGGTKTNQRLSQKRAQSAVDYIVNSGIDGKRIVAKGYGESKIKNRCVDGVRCSEDEHQQNRRTEIKILSIN